MITMTHAEWLAEAERRFGPDPRGWKFVCPMCGTIQSAADLLATGKFVPGSGEVNRVLAYSCIGRFTGQGDAGISAKNRGQKWDKGCNWTLGGLFQVHRAEVDFGDGSTRPVFEFADIEPHVSAASAAAGGGA